MRASVRHVGLVVAVVLAGCSSNADDGATGDEADVKSGKSYSEAERDHYLHTAKVFVDDEIASKDLIAGPQGKGAHAFNEEVTCTFVEPEKENELGGTTSKFDCKIGEDKVRVKYTPDYNSNGGLYGEILGTRLLWALGFAADRIYPVRVTCLECPEDPWAAYHDFKVGEGPKGGARATRKFPYAVLEEKYDGKKIEAKDSQGWSFEEIRHDFAGEGGASLAEIDALKLVAVLMKYADSKAANQRLVCLPGAMDDNGTCAKSILMMQDLGVTFGAGATWFGFRLSHADPDVGDWTKGVWADRGSCEGALKSASDGTLKNPHISEGGRQMLLARLSQLTEKQLHDLFTAGRVLERKQTFADDSGNERLVTIDDWVALFRAHVQEIASVTCPP